jgi:signal transduction histidine kinase
LSIVAHVVEQHGGQVDEVESTPGVGTAFTLRLPRCPELVEGLA